MDSLYRDFRDRLEPFRNCLTKSLLGVAVAFPVTFLFSDFLLALVMDPLRLILQPGQDLIGTGVTEVFFVKIKVALVGGIFLVSPLIFYQVWQIIPSSSGPQEGRFLVPFVIASSLFFVIGAHFCYWGVLPFAFHYFIGQFQSIEVSPEIRIGEYFAFFLRMILAFGLAFELPVFTFFMVRLGVWDHRFLWRQFRYAVVAIFILAAVLTPGPDVVSQILLALPLTLLYLLSIGVAYLWRRKE